MNLGRAIDRLLGWRAGPVRLADLDVPLGRVRRALLALIVLLVPVNLLVGYLKWLDYEDHEQPLAFLRFFDLGEEQNVPAWIATLLLAGSALAAVAASQRAHNDPVLRRGFLISAGALAYMSLDEASYLHERASDPIRDSFGVGGLLYWAWVLPALVAVGALAVLLWPFMRRLPVDVRNDLVLSAAVFLGCSVGIEMLDGLAFDINDEEASVVTEVLTIIEEIGEKLAVMLSLDTFLRYAATEPAASSPGCEEVRHEG